MKKLIDNFKFTDISLSIILSVIFSIKIYSHLYGISYYSDLNDFYVGTSIYLNYNKHLDLYILFIYLILFFCLLPIIYILRQKFLNHKKNVEKYKKQTKKIESNKYLNRIKSFLSKYQIIGVLGYIFYTQLIRDFTLYY